MISVIPEFPYLYDIWRQVIKGKAIFTTWEFVELGYGVALAVRKEA